MRDKYSSFSKHTSEELRKLRQHPRYNEILLLQNNNVLPSEDFQNVERK